MLVSTHPRTRKRLDADSDLLRRDQLVRFHPPFGFLDYNRLQPQAACVLSDSGTISEESTMLGFPAVTLRSSIERPEALDTGSITMTDLDPATVVAGVEFAMDRGRPPRGAGGLPGDQHQRAGGQLHPVDLPPARRLGRPAPMRILAAHRYFWPDSPPYAVMLREIGRAWVADGHSVSVVSSQPSYKQGSVAPAAGTNAAGPDERFRVRRLRLPHEQGQPVRRLRNAVMLGRPLSPRQSAGTTT